jgi:hypothetical protein
MAFDAVDEQARALYHTIQIGEFAGNALELNGSQGRMLAGIQLAAR